MKRLKRALLGIVFDRAQVLHFLLGFLSRALKHTALRGLGILVVVVYFAYQICESEPTERTLSDLVAFLYGFALAELLYP
jgi:hypothetical protein